MPNTIALAFLFLSSFAPLFFLFGLLNTFKNDAVSNACYLLAVLSVVFLLVFLWVARRLQSQDLNVTKAKPRDADTIGYVVTYLVPFLTIPANSLNEQFALLFFVILIGVLYVRSHIFYVNPILSLVGFRLFELELGSGFAVLITRASFIQPGKTRQAHRLGQYVFIEVGS